KPSARRSASVKPVDLLSLGSCSSSMPRLLVPVLEADIGFSTSEVSSSGMRPTFVTDQGRRAAPLLRARWPGIRNGHQAAPGDQVGRAVVAIDDAFDQRRPIVIGKRYLDRLSQLAAIGDADAA